MKININELKKDLKEELMGAAFGGGFGGVLMQSIDIDRYSDEQLIRQAMANGLDLSKYKED